MTGLSVHTLRYYEKVGLLNEVKRDINGYRQYAESDISWINFVIRLRITGMSVTACDPEITAFIMVRLYVSLIFDWEKYHEPLEKGHSAELFELYLLKGLSK